MEMCAENHSDFYTGYGFFPPPPCILGSEQCPNVSGLVISGEINWQQFFSLLICAKSQAFGLFHSPAAERSIILCVTNNFVNTHLS